MKNRPFRERLGFAINGCLSAFRSEASFRFQLLAALGALVFLFVLKASALWFAIFTLAIAAVLSAELFNTALEKLIDHLHPEVHPAIKIAKDCAAGAVLIFSCASIVVLVCFLVERYL